MNLVTEFGRYETFLVIIFAKLFMLWCVWCMVNKWIQNWLGGRKWNWL